MCPSDTHDIQRQETTEGSEKTQYWLSLKSDARLIVAIAAIVGYILPADFIT